MGYSDIKDDNPKLVSFDLCRDSDHLRRSRWDYQNRDHDGAKAVTIVAEVSYEGDKLRSDESAIYCRKHAAPSKGSVTRGTYAGQKLIIVEGADVSSREVVEAQALAKLAERLEAEDAEKARAAKWVEDNRPQHLIDRLVVKGYRSVGIGVDRTFGTSTVVLDYKGMTPGEARDLAAKLLEAADKAEPVA